MTTSAQIARANGCKIPVLAWDASRRVGVPFWATCAFLEQESAGGENVYGHDGGWYSGAGVVTAENYADYKAGRASHNAQGVGPMQLTWPPFQDAADALGGCWLPLPNVVQALTVLKGFIDAGKTWHEAAALYNGSEGYADQMDGRFANWQALLKDAEDGMDSRYQKINFRGHKFDRMTAQAIEAVEAKLGYEMTITQGSYNTSVPQSGGTHAGGGAADLVPWHFEEKVLACRQVGFAAWHRPYLPGVWGEHIHIELLGNERASDAAKEQWTQYRNGQNGLADHGPDNGPRLDPIPMFHYTPGGKVPPPEDPPQPPPPRPPGHYAREIAVQHALGDAIHAVDAFKADFPDQHLFDTKVAGWRTEWAEIAAQIKAG